MKPLHQLLPARSLSALVFLCLLALAGGLARAQAPVAERLDVFFGETKLLPIEHPIDDFTVTPDNIIRVDKVEGAPNELSLVGIAGGDATLTIKSNGQTFLYDVAVSPAPERLYINLNESKRLTFPNPIDDTSISLGGIVRVVQPDSSDRILLVEADLAGKTTLTVYSKGEIYRYFISTFENRGADILEIQNAFSAKGYRNLTISFDKDQAVIGGTVPTQEELDDAVHIVKQFTQYVVVKASLGQANDTSEFSEEEQVIINNIQRIANVKGLTVRVKFPAPKIVYTTTYAKSTGDYIEPTTTTTPQGGTIRGTGFLPPSAQNQTQSPTNAGPLELKPQQNTTESTTTTRDFSIPEKIFLYGDLENDLDEAKVLRVARTFCPFIVSFLTVKDPIQIRTQIRFLQFQNLTSRTTGMDWSGSGAGPTLTLGFNPGTIGGAQGFLPNPINAFKNYITAPLGVAGSINAQAILNLFETVGLVKLLREADLFLTNGQPGWYSEGEAQTYLSTVTPSTSTTSGGASTSTVFLGVNMDISPLNSLQSTAPVDPAGQKILGIQGASGTFAVQSDSTPSNDKVGKISFTQQGGAAPTIDNTIKYVDENGLIGLNISTQLTLPGTFATPTVDGIKLTLPDIFVRATRTRANLRDGQSVMIDGLIDQEADRTITQVPFLSDIPLFGAMFKNFKDTKTNNEVIVLVTPHIVRMRDPDSSRYPKPLYPEMQDLAREYGDVPIIKPVRYDVKSAEVNSESPKDMKGDMKEDTKDASGEPPLTPHASGGMQVLQPPSDASQAPATPARPVDNMAPATDTPPQPSAQPPPAPPSTLP